MTCSLLIVGLLDSVTLQVPAEKALTYARVCWNAGGPIEIELRDPYGNAWIWRGGRDRLWTSVLKMGGML